MRKSVVLFLMGVMLCISGCNNATDNLTTEMENVETEQSVGTDEAVPQTVAETQYNITDGEVQTTRITYSGATYTWQEVTIIIPEEWEGKYVLEETEDDLFFFQKASKEKDETMGWLCSISKRTEYYNDVPETSLIAYTKDGTFYYVSLPTDVTFFAEDETIASEYMNMAPQCEWIAGSMTSADETICFDGNQYVLLTSSMLPIEDYQLMNLSNNSLWIARNEIFARHGKVFENTYLDSYFRTCSWYQPIEGKTEVPEIELSQIELDNLEKIMKAEKNYADAHPYPQQYETNTRIVKRLQGDEVPFDVIYQTSVDDNWNYSSILKIDGNGYDLADFVNMADPVQDVFILRILQKIVVWEAITMDWKLPF